jgi:plastocyanin
VALDKSEVVEQCRLMLKWRADESPRLNRIHSYLRGTQPVSWVNGVPDADIRRLARISRVNMLRLVVESVTQSMYVDGYRARGVDDNSEAWGLWQRNRMDSRQIGVHRAALAYGASYVTVLPGEPVAAIRGISPRNMTAVYGEDDWPMWALERRLSADPKETLYRLFDQDRVYWLSVRGSAAPVYVSEDIHGVGVVPAVRFRPIDDLDDETLGEIDDLMVLQDQIDVTTFGLLVAQHYGAFRQRYVLGWLAETEEQKLTAMASRLWTFEENKDEMAVGEFSQTDLKGYLDSREASIRHLASVSQTPAHELVGQLVNLSAEALAAAEASKQRKVEQRQTVFGESWEQVFELGDEMAGRTVDYGAEVRWRDTEARALAATVDALGKMAQMLMIPPEMLWEKIPGVSTKDVARWKDAAARGDSLASLEELLRVQATEV